jgi:hypothetical protein
VLDDAELPGAPSETVLDEGAEAETVVVEADADAAVQPVSEGPEPGTALFEDQGLVQARGPRVEEAEAATLLAQGDGLEAGQPVGESADDETALPDDADRLPRVLAPYPAGPGGSAYESLAEARGAMPSEEAPGQDPARTWTIPLFVLAIGLTIAIMVLLVRYMSGSSDSPAVGQPPAGAASASTPAVAPARATALVQAAQPTPQSTQTRRLPPATRTSPPGAMAISEPTPTVGAPEVPAADTEPVETGDAEADEEPTPEPALRRSIALADDLRVRALPSLSSANVTSLRYGTPLDVLSGSVFADGLRWQRVRTSGGAIGWVSASAIR